MMVNHGYIDFPDGVVNGGEALELHELPPSPHWASERDVDEGFITHSRLLATIVDCGDLSSLDIRIVQIDCLDFRADPPTLTRLKPEVRCGEIRMNEQQARDIAALLARSADFVRTATQNHEACPVEISGVA